MKLRVRKASETYNVIIRENVTTISELKRTLIEQVPVLSILNSGDEVMFDLSLNQHDVLEPELELSNSGLVDGDLLFIITEQPVFLNVSNNMADRNSQTDNLLVTAKQTTSSRLTSQLQHDTTNSSEPNSSSQIAGSVNPGNESMEIGNTDPSTSQSSTGFYIDEVSHVMACLNEPLLLRDSSSDNLPSIVLKMYRNNAVETNAEAVCVVLHALMLECGFTFKSNKTKLTTDTVSKTFISLPSREDWIRASAFVFNYTHSSSSRLTCSLTCITIGQNLICHACLNDTDVHTLNLKPADYVCRLTSDCIGVYKKLNKLSILFANAIGLPLQHDILTFLGVPNRLMLTALPAEIQLQILSCLDVLSLIRVSQVCNCLHAVACDPFLWRRLYLATFGSRESNDINQDWKQLYRTAHKQRLDRRHQQAISFFLHPDNSVAWPYRPLPYMPPHFGIGGIRGGEYDLRPPFEYPRLRRTNDRFFPRRVADPNSMLSLPLHPTTDMVQHKRIQGPAFRFI